VYCEQSVFKRESLSFEGSSTPIVVPISIYPLKKMLPPTRMMVLVTYYQLKDKEKQNGGTSRCIAHSVDLPFSFGCQVHTEVEKENDDIKLNVMLDK
jgi:hypothetical protein